VSVVCCQVEVSATSWSLVQRSPTDCGVSQNVCDHVTSTNEEAQAHIGLSSHRKKIPRTSLSPRPYKIFSNIMTFYGEDLLAPHPTSNLGNHPLSSVHHCLFKIFAATIHIWRPFLHPQPEDAPCCGGRDNYCYSNKRTISLNKKMKSAKQCVG
jgi:hypothetical protein